MTSIIFIIIIRDIMLITPVAAETGVKRFLMTHSGKLKIIFPSQFNWPVLDQKNNN